MAIVGKREIKQYASAYEHSPLRAYAESFKNLAENIVTESGVNILLDPQRSFIQAPVQEAMRNFFVENSTAERGNMTAEEYQEHIDEMNALYENDLEAVQEYAAVAGYNPVIGMSFPIHKNILMNCVFDKGAIQKAVAVSPKFTFTMEYRYLVKPDGTKIDLFLEQNKIKDAINSTSPVSKIKVSLPEIGYTDILTLIGASPDTDNLSIDTYISKVYVDGVFEPGDKLPDGTTANEKVTKELEINTNIRFTPGYAGTNAMSNEGNYDRQCLGEVKLPDAAKVSKEVGSATITVDTDIVTGTMKENKFQINSLKGIIKAVEISAMRDASNGLLQTCSVRWDTATTIEEIGPAIPINVPVSPDEVKDLGALYNVNQITKVMSIINEVLENYKDDTIKEKLDISFANLPSSSKIQGEFDFAPRTGYALDHVEWRHKTFFDALDSYVTDLLKVLNDPNITVSIFGRPDIVRKITPTEYTFQTPSSVGPLELNFVKTIMTSDKRTYQFISSQKLDDSNELIIVLNPRNSDRVIYRIYDYQLYVSNEVKNAKLYTLPSIHAFERWKFVEYQPVQGRLNILNPTGLVQD